MWHIGFSLSLKVGDGISTSFCLSGGGKTQRLPRMETYVFCLTQGQSYKILWLLTDRFVLPRKVVEMYSDTWFPERLISDKWDSSLFNILLNWGKDRQMQEESDFKSSCNIEAYLRDVETGR